MIDLLYSIIIGGISGFLAGILSRGKGFGMIGNVIVGFIGAYAGNIIFNFLNISPDGGALKTILVSVVGAFAITFVINIFVDK